MGQKKIYSTPKLFDAESDPTKDWYVYYSYRNPFTGRMKRFRVKKGLDKHTLISDRIRNAKRIIKELTDDLDSGFNPFNNYVQPVNCYASSLVHSEENWENCLNDFVLLKKSEGLEEDSLKAYNSKIKKFCSYLIEKDIYKNHVSLFTYEKATQFMFWLQENGCKAKKTLREYRYFLSRSSDYLRKRRLITENVFDLLPSYKGVPTKPTLFSDGQLKKIKAYCLENDRQLWTICQFVLYCFFRPNKEVRLMRVGQIDWINGLLWSNETTSKNDKKQAVVIPQHFLEWLTKEGYQLANPDDYMFTITGKPGEVPIGKNYIQKHFKKIRKTYAINTYLYALKHTGNRKLKDMNIDLLDIMKQN
ncbi:MAG: site-specific integrase, partial [Bacteroidales bacterium]